MKKITRKEWNTLEENNLLKHRKVKGGKTIQEPNYYVANKEHNGRAKTYFIVEDRKLLTCLGYIKPRYHKNKNDR